MFACFSDAAHRAHFWRFRNSVHRVARAARPKERLRADRRKNQRQTATKHGATANRRVLFVCVVVGAHIVGRRDCPRRPVFAQSSTRHRVRLAAVAAVGRRAHRALLRHHSQQVSSAQRESCPWPRCVISAILLVPVTISFVLLGLNDAALASSLISSAFAVFVVFLLAGATIYAVSVLKPPSDPLVARAQLQAEVDSRRKLLLIMRGLQVVGVLAIAVSIGNASTNDGFATLCLTFATSLIAWSAGSQLARLMGRQDKTAPRDRNYRDDTTQQASSVKVILILVSLSSLSMSRSSRAVWPSSCKQRRHQHRPPRPLLLPVRLFLLFLLTYRAQLLRCPATKRRRLRLTSTDFALLLVILCEPVRVTNVIDLEWIVTVCEEFGKKMC